MVVLKVELDVEVVDKVLVEVLVVDEVVVVPALTSTSTIILLPYIVMIKLPHKYQFLRRLQA